MSDLLALMATTAMEQRFFQCEDCCERQILSEEQQTSGQAEDNMRNGLEESVKKALRLYGIQLYRHKASTNAKAECYFLEKNSVTLTTLVASRDEATVFEGWFTRVICCLKG